MSYRQAKPQEIADCIMRQEVEACDMAETEEYKNKPVKLRKLIRDIKICAVSNAHWVAGQRWGGPVNAELLTVLKTVLEWAERPETYDAPLSSIIADPSSIVRAAIAKAEA